LNSIAKLHHRPQGWCVREPSDQGLFGPSVNGCVRGGDLGNIFRITPNGPIVTEYMPYRAQATKFGTTSSAIMNAGIQDHINRQRARFHIGKDSVGKSGPIHGQPDMTWLSLDY